MLLSKLIDHSLEMDISSLDLIVRYIGTLLEIISDIAHGSSPFCGCNAGVENAVRVSVIFSSRVTVLPQSFEK